MKVVVDELRCDAHGVCVDACPEVFALNDDDDIVRVLVEEPDESLRASSRPCGPAVPEGRDHDRGLSDGTDERRRPDAELADRLAITDVVVRYFELVDAKGWDRMHEVFTEDTTARWTPTASSRAATASSAPCGT